MKQQVFTKGDHSIVPIRMEDRYLIMKWRNEQIYHLRQNQPLTKDNQDKYFNTVVAKLFDKEQPDQLLFSYLEDDKCIGYGGLVHIDWVNKNAEISFVLDSKLELVFENHWTNYLQLIEKVAFEDLKFHKLYTYSYNIRANLFKILENNRYSLDAILKEHAFYKNEFIDVIIHYKTNSYGRY